MSTRILMVLTAMVLAACSSSKRAPAKGRIVVAITVDWEGAYLSPEGLDALDELRERLVDVPLTHFVSAAYFTKERPDPTAARYIADAVHRGDEVGLHLHAWRSLARASGLEPRLHPSFLTGTNELVTFEDGDVGFDTDLDVYSVIELRAMLRTSRELLAASTLPVSTSFRAGGYLGTPKVLQAIREEGQTVDSSAVDPRQLGAAMDAFLVRRIREVWPDVGATSQPYTVDVTGGQLLEMPIAAIADHSSVAELIALFDAAHARLRADAGRDLYVVLALHQETAGSFAARIGDALEQVRKRRELADVLLFTTIEAAAQRARSAPSP